MNVSAQIKADTIPERHISVERPLCAITGHTEQKAKKEAFRTYSKGAGMKELTQYI